MQIKIKKIRQILRISNKYKILEFLYLYKLDIMVCKIAKRVNKVPNDYNTRAFKKQPVIFWQLGIYFIKHFRCVTI